MIVHVYTLMIRDSADKALKRNSLCRVGMLSFESLEELALASAVQVMRAESVFDMTVTHGDVRRFRVGGLYDDRFETASPRQGRVSAGWRPKSGLNNAVPSMAEAWSSTAGAGLEPAHRQEAGAECR